MCESKQAISKLLLAFADAIESMNDREFEMLVQGKAKLRLVEKPASSKKPVLDSYLDQAVAEIAHKLNESESRETAEAVIASINQPRRRDFLLRVSKACDVTVGSKDNIARIEQKLIENIVGSKLRLQAIKKVAF